MGTFGDIFNDTRFDFGTFEVKRDFVNEYGDVATLGRGFVSDFNASMDYALGIRNSLYDESDFPMLNEETSVFDGEDTRHIGYETARALQRASHSAMVPQYVEQPQRFQSTPISTPIASPQLATQDVIRQAADTSSMNIGFNFNARPGSNQQVSRRSSFDWFDDYVASRTGSEFGFDYI